MTRITTVSYGRGRQQADHRSRLARRGGRDLQPPGPDRLVGRGRRSAAASGTPSAAATPRHSSAVLADFARMDVKAKRVVVHDGTGHSFWLAPNREPEKLAAAKIDWVFMVWQPASWERLRKLPADLNPTEPADTVSARRRSTSSPPASTGPT